MHGGAPAVQQEQHLRDLVCDLKLRQVTESEDEHRNRAHAVTAQVLQNERRAAVRVVHQARHRDLDERRGYVLLIHVLLRDLGRSARLIQPLLDHQFPVLSSDKYLC